MAAVTFNPPLEKVFATLERGISYSVQASATLIGNRLIGATPVDTGWLRRNWTVAPNSPHGELFGTYGPKYERPTIPYKTYGDTIFEMWVTNSVPYARYQEYGGRGRKGKGFMAATAAGWDSIFSISVSQAMRSVSW